MKNRNLEHKDSWGTPPLFYGDLNKEFNFDFDPCPFEHDLTLWDGLEIDWKSKGNSIFINPPYSQKLKEGFTKKAVFESKKGIACVMLLPVSTSTKLFHQVIKPNITEEIRFVEGRLPFYGINDKGQFVNYDQIMEIDKTATIDYEIFNKDEEKFEIIQIPKYVKNSGQHDSMVCIFDYR